MALLHEARIQSPSIMAQPQQLEYLRSFVYDTVLSFLVSAWL
jgi:hypothetical protein